MGVRNCAELGEHLQTIVKRLMANDDLVKLLYYTDADPLAKPNLTEEEKKEKIFGKLIKILPRVGPRDTANSLVVLRIVNGLRLSENSEFKNVELEIGVFTPLTEWIMKGTNLRPFAILGEIQKSLDGKTINGLGKMSGGDFDLDLLTEEFSCYISTYSIVDYD